MASTPAMSERQRFITFIVTGGAAAALNLAARWLLSHVMPYEIAVSLAYLVGMTSAFLLAKRYVFAAGKASWVKEYARFAAVNVVSFLVVLGVSVGLARLFFPWIGFDWHAEDVAHLIGVASPVVLSYFAHKHFTFAD